MKISRLLSYFFIPIYQPFFSLKQLLNEKQKLSYALVIYLFLGLLYEISVLVAYSRGLGAQLMPFIKIPAEEYYFWQLFFQIPVFIIIAILYAGLSRLLAVTFHGTGSFENLFCLICVAITFPMFFTMWIPESFEFFFFPGRNLFPDLFHWIRQLIGIIWPLIIVSIGLHKIESISWFASIFITLVAFIPCGVLMVLVIR